MPKPLIFNSSPLIYLTKVSLAHLFKEIPEEKFTTTGVFDEVVREGKRKGAPEALLVEGLFGEKIIRIRDPEDKEYLKFLKRVSAEAERQPLHEAEAEVLCVARDLNGIAITDDRIARSVARLLRIELHGTGYVLGRIFVTGKIGKDELIGKVREMRDEGWYVAPEDYLSIIEYLKKL